MAMSHMRPVFKFVWICDKHEYDLITNPNETNSEECPGCLKEEIRQLREGIVVLINMPELSHHAYRRYLYKLLRRKEEEAKRREAECPSNNVK